MTLYRLKFRLLPVVLLFSALLVGYAGWFYPEPLTCLDLEDRNGTSHPGMVWIPPGSFAFGDSIYPEEQPILKTTVAGFWMDRTEVTIAQFADFVKATGYITTAERPLDALLHADIPPELREPGAVVFINPIELSRGGDVRQWWKYIPGANWRYPEGPKHSIVGRNSHPVVSVTIEDAQAYARWRGHDLPREDEWEWAALGGQTAREGDKNQPDEANTWQGVFPLMNEAHDRFVGTAPVACFKPNGYGLFDMIGNVWELTSTPYMESHNPQNNVAPDQAPPVQRPGSSGSQHVIKGGSFLCAPNYCMRYRPGARQGQEDDLATSHLGFRTVLRAPER
jgi:sulfatase modifying factor 1